MLILDYEDGDISYDQIMNSETIQKEPNFILFKYKKIMSGIFFIFSIVNLFLYALKIYRLQYKEIGFLKRLIYMNLFCLVLYNLIYSFE